MGSLAFKKHCFESMIQYVSATARLCGRRTSPQIWQTPSAILQRPALRARNQKERYPTTHIFYPQQRSLSISLDRHSRPSECRNVSKYQNSHVIIDEEKVLTTIDNHSESSPGLDNETIYAKSSGPDASAIAVIRISGPACAQIYHSLCPDRRLPRQRYAAVRTLYHPKDKTNILDSDAVVIRFDAPNTATGEDMLELHTHGGIATVTAGLSAIGQIDSLGDILTAETELQRRASLRGPYQQLGRIYDQWRTSLIEELAHAAADTDHSEEHSLDDMAGTWDRIIEKVQRIQEEITYHQMGA